VKLLNCELKVKLDCAFDFRPRSRLVHFAACFRWIVMRSDSHHAERHPITLSESWVVTLHHFSTFVCDSESPQTPTSPSQSTVCLILRNYVTWDSHWVVSRTLNKRNFAGVRKLLKSDAIGPPWRITARLFRPAWRRIVVAASYGRREIVFYLAHGSLLEVMPSNTHDRCAALQRRSTLSVGWLWSSRSRNKPYSRVDNRQR